MTFTLCVSIPPSYPFSSSAPQLQLLSRYIGAFGVDADLFGAVMRTFISHNAARGGLPLWNPPQPGPDEDEEASTGTGDVVIFDGVESVRALLTKWYGEKSSEAAVAALAREEEEPVNSANNKSNITSTPSLPASTARPSIPEGIEIIEGPPIQDRGSSFIARVCRITHPSQVRPSRHDRHCRSYSNYLVSNVNCGLTPTLNVVICIRPH